MRADASLDLGRVEKQAEYLVSQGAVGVFVGGTTGEGLSLTVPERQQLTERWCAVAGKQFPVIVHVGHNSVPDARDLAAHARKAGAEAVAAVAPFYYKPDKVQAVVTCCAAIASAAPDLPFYYYHIPGNTGLKLNVVELMEAASHRIPTLAGLKFSDNDLVQFGRCVVWGGDGCDLFFGTDELLLPALALGAKAAIGTTYNFAAPLYRRMIDAFNRGDMDSARAAQTQSRDLLCTMRKHGGLAAMKATMRLAGVDCGPCRPPLRTLDEQELGYLERSIEDFRPLMRPEGSEAR
jgi:N-acetylneuraminate lyase